jgi:hypothetical protein
MPAIISLPRRFRDRVSEAAHAIHLADANLSCHSSGGVRLPVAQVRYSADQHAVTIDGKPVHHF